MNRTPMFGALACCALASSSALAQDSVIYEFDLAVIQNQLIDRGISSRFDELTIGTPGMLRFEVETETTDYPGFTDENNVFYSILNVSFSAGPVLATGAPGAYPSQTFSSSLAVVNDSLYSAPNSYQDAFYSFFALGVPDISLGLLFINQNGIPGQTPDIFGSTDLPTASELASAPTQSFFFQTSYDPSARVTFGIGEVRRFVVPAPQTSGLLALGGLVALRRRR